MANLGPVLRQEPEAEPDLLLRIEGKSATEALDQRGRERPRPPLPVLQASRDRGFEPTEQLLGLLCTDLEALESFENLLEISSKSHEFH